MTDINESLIALKSELEAISTARQQVETVTKSSNELHEKTQQFVLSVNKLAANVNQLIHAIDGQNNHNLQKYADAVNKIGQQCNEVVSEFSIACDDANKNAVNTLNNAVLTFKQHTSEQLQQFKEGVSIVQKTGETLAEAVEKVTSLQSTLDNLMQELKSSQLSQDQDLLQIKQALAHLKENLNQQSTNIENYVKDIQSSFSNQIESIQQQLTQLENNTQRDISESKDYLQQQLSQLETNTQQDISRIDKKLTTKMQNVQYAVKKDINTNRIILGINLVLLLVLLIKSFL